MRELKILHVVPYYPPAYSFGGPVKLVSEIAGLQKQLGHKVSILTTDVLNKNERSNLPFYTDEDGIEVYRVQNLNNTLAAKYNLYLSSELNKFFDLDLSFDIVHYHDFRSVNNFFISNYFIKKNVKQVMSPYGSMSIIDKKVEKNIFDALFGNKIISNINKFFAVNEVEKNYIKSFTGKDVAITPNSIDLGNIVNTDFDVRKEFNLPDKKIVLFISRMHKMKNPEMFVEAFSKLSSKDKEKSIGLIIGPDEGAYDSTVQKIKELGLTDKIFIVNKHVKDERWSIYKQSDVFVLPTNDQAFPLVMLEALSQNLPIVTSEVALKDKLPQELGSIVDYDVDQFADKISFYLNSPKPEKGFEFVDENYSVKSTCEVILNNYLELL